MKSQEVEVEFYLNTIRQEVENNKAKLLVYEKEGRGKTDVNVPSLWRSSLATILAIVAILIDLFVPERVFFDEIGGRGNS